MELSRTDISAAIDFLLEQCPIAEIENEQIIDVIESFRCKMMNKQSAIKLITEMEQKYIEKYIATQQNITKEISRK